MSAQSISQRLKKDSSSSSDSAEDEPGILENVDNSMTGFPAPNINSSDGSSSPEGRASPFGPLNEDGEELGCTALFKRIKGIFQPFLNCCGHGDYEELR